MYSLGGLPFIVTLPGSLSAAELHLLEAFASAADGQGEPFTIEIVDRPLFSDARISTQNPGPAVVSWSESQVRLMHSEFESCIDPIARIARLYRRVETSFGLQMTLKCALAASLPLHRGVMLHAAGVIVDGVAYIFFGPSGAGKSTISSLSPFPLLSDENVVLVAETDGTYARASGFWGTLDRSDAPRGTYRVHALIELQKGSDFRIVNLRSDGIGALFGSSLVYPLIELWRPALATIARIVEREPVYRLSWSPAVDVWGRITEQFKSRSVSVDGGA